MIDNLKNTFENFNKNITNKNNTAKIRKDNFDKFLNSGFPNKKLEDWKFSDFKKIISQNLKNLKINLKDKKKLLFDNSIKEFNHNDIFFLNGFYNKHSFKYEDDKKIIFSNLKNGPAYEPKGNNSLNLLNNAFFTDGLLLYVKKGYKCKKPLVIYNIFDGNNENNFFNQKLIVNIEENSELNILVYTINLNANPIFLNTSNFFLLEKNSLLKLFYLNELGKKDLNYNFTETKILENSNFENFILSYSSSFFKNEINCDLKEKYSSGFINGAIFAKKNQHHEIKTKVNHFGETTKSYQKIKSIVDKNSKTIFQGKIYVDQKAQKTNGYQLSKAILLDKESEFDSKPELEIYADDVKCSHGSTSGNLDENSIFYLMSRGLNEKQAKNILIKGFLSDAVETITNMEIKDYFLKKIEKNVNEYK
tara:strand:+ start:423 stop:1682 length:1260 start_codon:yes stop_codon:yes gene_type:complete